MKRNSWADEDVLDTLAAAEMELEGQPDHAPVKREYKPWYPDLNPTQNRSFNDATKFILLYGEKGSGKSISGLNQLVRHCYENANAFALIIAPSIRTGADGVVHDLENLVLPTWKYGNQEAANLWREDGVLVANPRSGLLKDEGIGLESTPFKPEFDTKDRVLWIANMHGGWSKVKLISIPYAEAIAGRIKGPAPSFVYVEELTDLDDIDYFRLTAAQLGRRRGIAGPQQWVASCNPKGPSHWVYKHFFVDTLNPETGERDKDYAIYHVPVSENMHRLPLGYVESLEKIFKSDPIQKRRLLDGEWIDMPTGEALFRDQFVPTRHVIGEATERTGINPVPGVTIIISADLGQVNSCAVFSQCIPTKDGLVWSFFDEVIHLNQKILYRVMAREIFEKMELWEEQLGVPARWEMVTGADSTKQYRPGHGDYDATLFEREINKLLLAKGKQPIRVVGAPSGDGSVTSRVRLVQELFFDDKLFISAMCPKTKEALQLVEGDPKKPMHPKKSAGGYDHTFDAMSYAIAKVSFGSRSLSTEPGSEPVRVLTF